MFPFAQLAPPGTESVLAILFYLFGGATSVVLLIQAIRKKEPTETVISKQPVHIRAAEEFVSRREHEDLKKDVRDLRAENRALIADQSRESRESFKGVHDRITDLLAAFRELRGGINSDAIKRHI